MNLSAENATVKIHDSVIFENVSFSLKPGAVTSIIGPSGCGKTTLLNCMGLLQKLSSGQIIIDGVDATHWSSGKKRQFWRRSAAFVYQDSGVIEDETIFYNVALCSEPRFFKKRSLSESVYNALKSVGLSRSTSVVASVLSGGEKQRLGIARALYKNATIIFADEPTASLDEENRSNVAHLLRTCAENGSCVVIATHDMDLANSSDAIVRLTGLSGADERTY